MDKAARKQVVAALDLVLTTEEVAQELQLTKQRVSQLMRGPDFPKTVGDLGIHLWITSEIMEYKLWRQGTRLDSKKAPKTAEMAEKSEIEPKTGDSWRERARAFSAAPKRDLERVKVEDEEFDGFGKSTDD